MPDVLCFVNAQANSYSFQGQSEKNTICGAIQLAPGRTGKAKGRKATVTQVPAGAFTMNLAESILLYDSCAFTDVLTNSRVSPAQSLERQLSTLSCIPTAQETWIVSYDRLIDEKYIGGERIKERWSVKDGEIAVNQTVEAAKYLNSQRNRLNQFRLVQSCQGVDADQYLNCVEQVLHFCKSSDVLGLGGWCILGKQKRWLPVFWKTISKVIPLLSISGIKKVHVFGCTWYKPVQGFNYPPIPALLWVCDQYGIDLSIDGRSPIGSALWKNTWKKSGAKFPYWRHNLAWVKTELACLRDSEFYQPPPDFKFRKLSSFI